jgi:hypothetical protein
MLNVFDACKPESPLADRTRLGKSRFTTLSISLHYDPIGTAPIT